MSAPDRAPPESLPGDYQGFSIGSDFQTDAQSFQVLGETMGETTLTTEAEAVETQYHETAITQQHYTHYTIELEFMMAAIEGQPQLELLGTHDADGNVIGDATADHDVIRFHIFNDEPDYTGLPDSAALTFEFVDVQLRVGEMTFSPGDPAEIPVVGVCNGGWRRGYTPAPTSSTS